MKTKSLILSTFFALWLSTGFSQVDSNYNLDQVQESDPLTAMNSNFELANKADSDYNNVVAKITTYPEFMGNANYSDVNTYIYSNLAFPEEARITGRSGLVKVQFDIYIDGTIGNINIVESPDSSFNNEVLRLLKEMPNWKPALSGTNAVKSRYQLNINFSLR